MIRSQGQIFQTVSYDDGDQVLQTISDDVEPLRKLAESGDRDAVFKLARTTGDVEPLRALAQKGDFEAGLLVARITGDREPFTPVLAEDKGVERLQVYLNTRKKEFLEKLTAYEFVHVTTVGAGNDNQLPKKLEGYRILGRKNGGYDVQLEIFYIRNYTSSYTKIRRVLIERPDPNSALGYTFEIAG